jgi:hypothetical protein
LSGGGCLFGNLRLYPTLRPQPARL